MDDDSEPVDEPSLLPAAIFELLFGLAGLALAWLGDLMRGSAVRTEPTSIVPIASHDSTDDAAEGSTDEARSAAATASSVRDASSRPRIAPGIAFGHVVGRLGCFMAGCCYGHETNVPWAVTFTNPLARENVGTPLGVPLHPTQLYEAGVEAIILGLLLAPSVPFPLDWVGPVALWVMLALAVWSGVDYYRRFNDVLRKEPPSSV